MDRPSPIIGDSRPRSTSTAASIAASALTRASGLKQILRKTDPSVTNTLQQLKQVHTLLVEILGEIKTLHNNNWDGFVTTPGSEPVATLGGEVVGGSNPTGTTTTTTMETGGDLVGETKADEAAMVDVQLQKTATLKGIDRVPAVAKKTARFHPSPAAASSTNATTTTTPVQLTVPKWQEFCFYLPVVRQYLPAKTRLHYHLFTFRDRLAEFLDQWQATTTDANDETTNLAPLQYAYQLSLSVLFQFRRMYPLLKPLLLDSGLFARVLAGLQFSHARKVTSPHWAYLPAIPLQPIAQNSRSIETLLRHEIDTRFDRRILHRLQQDAVQPELYDDANRLMEKFFAAPQLDTQANVAEPTHCVELTATYPWINREHALYLELSRRKPAMLNRILNTEESELMEEGDPPPLTPLTLQYNPRDTERQLIYNDPNNDGYLLVRGGGGQWMLGGVADGSGAGHAARLAANLSLAAVYDRLVRDDVLEHEMETRTPLQEENSSRSPNTQNNTTEEAPAQSERPPVKLIPERKAKAVEIKVDPSTFQTSHDCFQFLLDAVMYGHRTLVASEEGGATTILYYMLMRVDGDAMQTFDSQNSRGSMNKDGNPQYVFTYMIAGDTDGYWFDSQGSQRWHSLHNPVLPGEQMRLDASVTPGGVGKRHGDATRLFGAHLLNSDGIANTSKSTQRAFYEHSNNVQFGQILCHPDDMVIVASDGLGDTLEPNQLFPRPSMLRGMKEYALWEELKHHQGQSDGFLEYLRDLKESAVNKVTQPADCTTKMDVKSVLHACVKHSMTVTAGTRGLLLDAKFETAKGMAANVIRWKKIDAWLAKNSLVVKKPCGAGEKDGNPSPLSKEQPSMSSPASPMTMRSPILGVPSAALSPPLRVERGTVLPVLYERFVAVKGRWVRKPYFLPEPHLFVPFAKVDHLGIQVLKVGLSAGSANNSNLNTSHKVTAPAVKVDAPEFEGNKL